MAKSLFIFLFFSFSFGLTTQGRSVGKCHMSHVTGQISHKSSHITTIVKTLDLTVEYAFQLEAYI